MKKYNTRPNSHKIQKQILRISEELKPRLIIRQLYFSLTIRGVIAKTEGGDRQTCYQLGKMRKQGLIPYIELSKAIYAD